MVHAFSLFISFLTVFFCVFHGKDLSLLNLSSRCMTFIVDLVDPYKVNLCIRKLFIQYNTDNCCAYVTGHANMYLYVCVCKYIGSCVSCVCLSVCVVSNKSTRKSHIIHVKPLVNLMSCCVKHAATCC